MLTAPLPAELEQAIAERSVSRPEHVRRSAELIRRYRNGHPAGPVARARDEVLAYAVARLPATYAAARVVLGELRDRDPSFAPVSQLDVGSGPGGALWAALDVWSSLRRLAALECESEMVKLAQELACSSSDPALADVEWIEGSAPRALPDRAFDLVTMAYVLGELENRKRQESVNRAWHASARALVIVEPGTPEGYDRVITARDRLIAAGAVVVAPCPHDRPCPLLASRDWCHFGVRVARTSLHRLAKGGRLGHEDEKFAYVAVARTPAPRADARILRHPQIRGGHVMLDLCTVDGVRRETISKRDRDRFRRARKSAWGEDLRP